MFTCESTSKADKFKKLDNFRSMKILNTPRTQKRHEICTKRHVQEQNPSDKKKRVQLDRLGG